MRFRVEWRSESGMALVMAVGISTVLLIVATAALAYSTSGATASNQSRARQGAGSLAEAGLNYALAVLNLPTNNAMLQRTLPQCTTNNTKYSDAAAARTAVSTWSQTADGSSAWCGTYVSSLQTWYLAAIGTTKDPNRGSGNVRSTMEATVTVTPNVRQPLGNPVWNYIYAGHTGSTCDQSVNNNVSGSSRMYVAGNLCIGNNAVISQTSLTVGGNLTLAGGNTAVGTSTSLNTRVQTEVGGNCAFGSNPPVVCTGNQDAQKVFSKMQDSGGNWVVGVNHTPRYIPPPTADYATWYQNAIPGPAKNCDFSSGPVPTFDSNSTMDNSVTPAFNLTPATAYDCRVGPAGTPTGEIRWTPPTASSPGQLYMTGTIFIDGSVYIATGVNSSTFAVQYSGMSALYLSGTFSLNGKLCATVTSAKTDCDFNSYDPNNAMITIVANGNGGQVNPGDSVQIVNNGEIQGALYGTNAIEFGNNSYSDGPIVGSTLIFGNNVTTNSFPNIDYVPSGDPGNNPVYGHPNPPSGFAG
jgi:hypothetical protein